MLRWKKYFIRGLFFNFPEHKNIFTHPYRFEVTKIKLEYTICIIILYLSTQHQKHKPTTSLKLIGITNTMQFPFEWFQDYDRNFVRRIKQQGPQMKSFVLTTPLLFMILENFMVKYKQLWTSIKGHKKKKKLQISK